MLMKPIYDMHKNEIIKYIAISNIRYRSKFKEKISIIIRTEFIKKNSPGENHL